LKELQIIEQGSVTAERNYLVNLRRSPRKDENGCSR
jgi:hypothetical protein